MPFRKSSGWTKPPNPVPINWGDPLTRALQFYLMPCGTRMVDLVGHDVSTLFGATSSDEPVVVPHISAMGGTAAKIQGSGFSDFRFADALRFNILGDITLVTRFMPTASSGSVVAKNTTNGGSDSPFVFGIGNPTASAPFFGRAKAGLNFRVWESSGATVASNVVHTMAVTQGADMSVAATFYLDGVASTSTSQFGGGGSGAPTASTTPLYVGMRDDGTTLFTGYVAVVMGFARILSMGEILTLTHSPFKRMLNAPRRRFASAVISGGGTFKPQFANQYGQFIGVGVN